MAFVAEWFLTGQEQKVATVCCGQDRRSKNFLVVEDGVTVGEAIADSVNVLACSWQEALSATVVVRLILLSAELGGRLLARLGLTGLGLTVLLAALAAGVAMVYLALRYVENVHQRLYDRDGQFAIGK